LEESSILLIPGGHIVNHVVVLHEKISDVPGLPNNWVTSLENGNVASSWASQNRSINEHVFFWDGEDWRLLGVILNLDSKILSNVGDI